MSTPSPTEYLLNSDTAADLYHRIAADCPKIDFHTHLPPDRFAENRPFDDLAEIWVTSDPYKWRAMRMHGIPEREITGDASPRRKFDAWAETLPHLAGNPLHDWSRLELGEFFGIEEPLTPDSADRIWSQANDRLREDALRPRDLLRNAGVETFVTSDAWLEPLEHHLHAAEAGTRPAMRPSLRADDAFAFASPGYADWLNRLGRDTGTSIGSLADFLQALRVRLDAFAAAGCRMSDHGIDAPVYAACSESEAEGSFMRLQNGTAPGPGEAAKLHTFLLLWLAGEYAKRGWTLQLHLGARRETSSRLATQVGRAGGYAVMRAGMDDGAVVSMLEAMESGGGLPRIILYSLNTADYEWMAAVSGSFVEDGVPGKVQLGPAWWYNDHPDGIERQLRAVSNYGMLRHSIGMNTDSRSFLSSVRHDVFRRVLCSLLGEGIDRGRFSTDSADLDILIPAVCGGNARRILEPTP